jgi:putative ABC transport system permease protein
MEGQKRKDLTMDDYHAIVEGCDACKVVGAAVNTFNGKVKHEEQSTEDTAIRGWTASMARIYDLELIAGRALNDIDTRNSSPVAVVGHDILENVLPNVDPIGKEIRIDGKVYTVIGVGKKEGQTLGQSRDNWVIIPITSWLKQYGTHDNSIRLWAKGFDRDGPGSRHTAFAQARRPWRGRQLQHRYQSKLFEYLVEP